MKFTHVNSSLFFFVTSHCKHILSSGSSCLLAVDCMMAVSNDWGLKNPANQTDGGNWNDNLLVITITLTYRLSFYFLILRQSQSTTFPILWSVVTGRRTKLPVLIKMDKLFEPKQVALGQGTTRSPSPPYLKWSLALPSSLNPVRATTVLFPWSDDSFVRTLGMLRSRTESFLPLCPLFRPCWTPLEVSPLFRPVFASPFNTTKLSSNG